jgi:hypothetical protein
VPRPIEGNQANQNKSKLSYPYSISFHPCSTSLYPKFCPNPNLLFFLRPGGDWRRSSWPADAITHQGAPTRTRSLLYRSSLDFHGDSWRPVWSTGWSRGRPGSLAARARAGDSVCGQILHQHNLEKSCSITGQHFFYEMAQEHGIWVKAALISSTVKGESNRGSCVMFMRLSTWYCMINSSLIPNLPLKEFQRASALSWCWVRQVPFSSISWLIWFFLFVWVAMVAIYIE